MLLNLCNYCLPCRIAMMLSFRIQFLFGSKPFFPSRERKEREEKVKNSKNSLLSNNMKLFIERWKYAVV